MALPRTNVAKLNSEVCTKPFRRALPSALPDHWLRPIVRDLRDLEESTDGDETIVPHMAGPLLLTMHIVVGRMKETGHGEAALIPEEHLASLMQIYQAYLEREIATRAIGRDGRRHDEELVAEIDRSIEALTGGH